MRTRRLSARALTAAASTALLLALAACGGEAGGGAADHLPEAGATVEPSEFAADMEAGLEASTTARMTMTVDAGGTGGLDASGQVDYTADPVAMQITSSNPLGQGDLEIVLVDGVMYLNQGSLTNDKYVAYDLSDTANLPPGLSGLEGQLDPLAAFEDFGTALQEVTFEGQDEVGGEDLAHYVVRLDPAEMESFQGMPTGAQLPEELEYDLYVDEEFRVRRLNLTMDGQPAIDLEVTLSEWGEPVDITAPPQDETVDPSQVQG